MTAIFGPLLSDKSAFKRVVLPAPKKPVNTVTGIRVSAEDDSMIVVALFKKGVMLLHNT